MAENAFCFLADDCRMDWLDGEPILFFEDTQKIFQIDAGTAALWPDIERGFRTQDLREIAAGKGIDGDAALASLDSIGALSVLEVGDRALNVEHRFDVKLAGCRIGVCCTSQRSYDLLLPLFGNVSGYAPCDLYVGADDADDTMGIVFDGDAVTFTWDEAAPAVKVALTEFALETLSDLALHAAVLASDGDAMILVGDPGAGKSTLSGALSASGFELEGDDIAVLSPDGQVEAMSFPATYKKGAWKLLDPEFLSLDAWPVFRRLDGKIVRYVPTPTTDDARIRRVRSVVLLKRNGGETKLDRLSAGDVVSGLIAGAWTDSGEISADIFHALVALANGAVGYSLTYGELAPAVAALTKAWHHDAKQGATAES